jgi:tRNA A-37 threonylcarbamoyl transferase component Bud32
VYVEFQGTEVRKTASSAEERARLAHEASVLANLAHPGVVQLVRAEDESSLVLRRVAGRPLSELQALEVDELAGLGAAVATVGGDLHHLGMFHGGLGADHVIVDPSGRPVLCSFGRSSSFAAGDSDRLRRQDAAALAKMLLSAAASRPLPKRMARALRQAASGRMSAGELAGALVGAIPAARLPGESAPIARGADQKAPSARRMRRSQRRSRTVAVAGGIAGALVAAAACVELLGTHGRESTRSPGPTVCPPVDLGCSPIPDQHGAISTATGRFQVGSAGDVVVVGRWDCSASAYAALLEPSSGQVWVFHGWARPGHPVRARLAGRVRGATSLRVDPQEGGCDLLLAERPAQRPVVLDPQRR